MVRYKGKRKHPSMRAWFTKPFAMLAVLALLALGTVGLVQSPVFATGGGNEDCPGGMTQLAKYNWDEDNEVYVAESGAGIVSVSGNATSGTFTVADGYEVSAVVVKGSNNAKTDTYDPPVTSGSFNNSGLTNPGGQTADISNLKFCGGGEEPPEPAPDTATADGGACVNPGEETGVVTVTITNGDDETNETRTYDISFNGATVFRELTLADGETGSVQYGGLAPTGMDWYVSYQGEEVGSGIVQVTECDAPHDECPDLDGNQPPGTDCDPPPHDECPDLDGNQPPGTDCDPPPADENDGLCHATGSESNPYVLIEDISSAGIFNGHFDEDGPGPEAPGDHQNNADIIPPFTYQGEEYSQNWDEAGQALFENDCVVDEEPPTDVCPNIPGDQPVVPDGYEVDDEGNCVPVEEPPFVCPDGSTPEDTSGNGEVGIEDCVVVVCTGDHCDPPPPFDECPDMEGIQPSGTDCSPDNPTIETGLSGPSQSDGSMPVGLLYALIAGLFGGVALIASPMLARVRRR
jgi:hypothetical protein